MTDLPTAKDFTFSIHQHTYTQQQVNTVGNNTFSSIHNPNQAQRTREIPVQTIPRGALMFHYFRLPDRNPYENNNDYSYRLLDVLLGQTGLPITFNSNTQRWTVCFGKVVTNYHYYYPNPSAGFGINGFGQNFNAGLICNTKRDTRWAYLKSGTSVDENVVNHRRYPTTQYQNYDFRRIKLCDQFINQGYCRPGNNFDICLSSGYIRNHNIDGITSIAQMDDIMDITLQNGNYVYNTNKPMFHAMNEWFRQINIHNNTQRDKLLWSMNMLSLESDYKPNINTLNIGFREFACLPFGHHHQTRQNFIPPQNLHQSCGILGQNYWIVDEQTINNNVILRRYEIDNDHIVNFLERYVLPNTLMETLSLVTPYGNIQDVNTNLIPYAQPIGYGNAADQNRYQLNHNIANYIMPYATDNKILWDMKLNVFYKLNTNNENYHDYEGDDVLNIQFQGNATHANYWMQGSPLRNPPYIRNQIRKDYYTYTIKANQVDRRNNEILKIAHEVISNIKWQTHWMNEIAFYPQPGSMDPVKRIPVGPFKNPLCLPMNNCSDIPRNYWEIISRLENIQMNNIVHSESYTLLEQENFRRYIRRWSVNNVNDYWNSTQDTLGGQQQYRYVMGNWFPDINFQNPHLLGVGGSRKKVKKTKKQKGGRSFEKEFLNNLRRSLNKRNTRKAMSNEMKASVVKDSEENNQQDGGHASPNAVDMSIDTFNTLEKMFKDPQFTPILRLFFGNHKSKKNNNNINNNTK